MRRKGSAPTPAELRERESRYATIHDRIRLRRTELGMTAAELARRCGVKTQAVQQWEGTGPKATTPRRPMVSKIAENLRITDVWIELGPPRGYGTASEEMKFLYEQGLRSRGRKVSNLLSEGAVKQEENVVAEARSLYTEKMAPEGALAKMITELPPDVKRALQALVKALLDAANKAQVRQ